MNMKKTFTLLALLLFPLFVLSQTYDVNLDAITQKKFRVYNKGSEVKITSIMHKLNAESGNKVRTEYYATIGQDTVLIDKKFTEDLSFKVNTIQDMWDVAVIKHVLSELIDNGSQENMRNEMEEEALEYINKQKSYGMVFNDPCLENYIYGLIAKIIPNSMIDGRPSNINLLILDSPVTNAGMFPNGTLVINTGLLSTLHTEDELVAVLSHEVAHFVLDHAVINVNKEASRKKRAEFWAGLATAVTAVAEGVAASKNEYYVPGAATLGMAVLSTSIAVQVVERLGMKYNHKQEEEADDMAMQTLEHLGYDKNALSTALNRMNQTMINERSSKMYFQSYTHPALVERISKAGAPYAKEDVKFEQEISFAVTSSARMKFEDRRFRQVLPLVNQNIENRVATSEDYILKANCLLALKNDAVSNNEIIQLIEKAKELDGSNINIYKSEILANIRLNKLYYVQELLNTYIQKLSEYGDSLNEIQNEDIWGDNYRFIVSERDWAIRMIIKIKSML